MNRHEHVIGVMGPGEGATEADVAAAEALGRAIGEAGWVLLCGGRDAGVMAAAARGAKAGGGMVVGVLPGAGDGGVAPGVDLAIRTGMGNARNAINALSSDVLVACGMGAGTASEVALALKSGVPVVLVNAAAPSRAFWEWLAPGRVRVAEGVAEAMRIIADELA